MILRRHPWACASAYSQIGSVAIANRWATADFLAAWGFSAQRKGALRTWADTVKVVGRAPLAAIFGIDAAEVDQAFDPELGSIWGLSACRLGTLRYCPLCLEVGYHHPLFQAVYVHSCPVHGVRLLDACSRCGDPLATDLQLSKGRPMALFGCRGCGVSHVRESKLLMLEDGCASEAWRGFSRDVAQWRERALDRLAFPALRAGGFEGLAISGADPGAVDLAMLTSLPDLWPPSLRAVCSAPVAATRAALIRHRFESTARLGKEEPAIDHEIGVLLGYGVECVRSMSSTRPARLGTRLHAEFPTPRWRALGRIERRLSLSRDYAHGHGSAGARRARGLLIRRRSLILLPARCARATPSHRSWRSVHGANAAVGVPYAGEQARLTWNEGLLSTSAGTLAIPLSACERAVRTHWPGSVAEEFFGWAATHFQTRWLVDASVETTRYHTYPDADCGDPYLTKQWPIVDLASLTAGRSYGIGATFEPTRRGFVVHAVIATDAPLGTTPTQASGLIPKQQAPRVRPVDMGGVRRRISRPHQFLLPDDLW